MGGKKDKYLSFYTACFKTLNGSCGIRGLKLRNWLLFMFMVLLWGSNWSIMKIGLRYIEPVAFVLQRYIVSAVVLLPFSLILRNRIPRDKRTLAKLAILCLIFVSVIVAQEVGLSQESSGVGAVLTYTQPLFVFLLAVPLLSEKVTKTRLLGVIIGFTGVFVLFINEIGSLTVNSAFILLFGAFLWGLAAVYYKKFLNNVDPLITHFSQLSVGIIPLLMLASTGSSYGFPNDAVYVEALFVSSVGALAVGNVIWFFLLREEEATTVTGSTLIIPAVALFFGWRLLGEDFSLQSLLGSALTLIGVYLLNMRRRSYQPSANQSKQAQPIQP